MTENGDFVDITLDTPFGDIVQYDQEGKKLRFDPELGKFRDLDDKELSELSAFSRGVYSAMESLNKQAKKIKENPPTPGLKIDPRYISPGEKLEVDYPPGFRDVWHPAWLLAKDYARNIGQGYLPVTEDDVQVAMPGLGAGSSKRIGTIEYDELVLMKIPLEEHKRRVALDGEKSRRNIGDVEARTIEDIRAGGGKEFVPPEGGSDGRNWTDAGTPSPPQRES